MEEIRERLRGQLFEEGANQHRTNLLAKVAQRKSCDDTEALAMVGHLLYEGLLFHHKHFTVAISGLAKRGLWRAACSLLSEMRDRGLEPNTISYNAALNSCRQAAAWEQAVAQLDDMQASGALPDAVSISIVMAACQKAKRWPLALELYASLPGRGLQPDKMCVSAALGACAGGSQWELALNVLARATDTSVRPDLVCHNGAITACAEARRWEAALGLLAALRGGDGPEAPDAISYNGTISACEAAHRWPEALQVFASMEPSRVPRTVVSYNAAMNAHWRAGCGEGGDEGWRGAIAVLADMRLNGIAPTIVTCGTLLAALTPHRRWQEGVSAVAEMQRGGLALDAKAWGALVALLFASGEQERAALAYRAAQRARMLTPWSPQHRGMVDLHRHVVLAAVVAIQVVLEDMVALGAPPGGGPRGGYRHDPARDLTLILGRGHGSASGEVRLAPELTAALRQDFSPPLELAPSPDGNPGRWVLRATSLTRWASAAAASAQGGA